MSYKFFFRDMEFSKTNAMNLQTFNHVFLIFKINRITLKKTQFSISRPEQLHKRIGIQKKSHKPTSVLEK